MLKLARQTSSETISSRALAVGVASVMVPAGTLLRSRTPTCRRADQTVASHRASEPALARSVRQLEPGACGRLPVLVYHHVGPRRDGTHRSLTVSPAAFERHVRWLARTGFEALSSADVIDWRRLGRPLPRRAFVLTFDDGYADLARFAFPVLRRYGFGAIVFLVSGRLGGTNAWDEVAGSGTHRLLSANQVREWAAKGIEFGAHGRTHADLTDRSTDLAEEVERSATDLEGLLGYRTRSFAYPFGLVDEAAVGEVRRTFDLAFTAHPGLNTIWTDPHLLRRTMVQPGDTLLDLRFRLLTGSNLLDRVRGAIRVRTRIRAVHRSLGRQRSHAR